MENNITINNRIPQLRFPGYTGDWEEKSLGEVGVFVRGLSYNKGEVTQDRAATLVLRSNNIIQDGAVDCRNGLQFVTKEPSTEQILQKGDIVICLSNGSSNLVGKSANYEGDYAGIATVGAFCGIYRSTAPIAKYLVQTPAYKKSVELIKQGGNGALANLYGRDILGLKFYFPTLEEQNEIVECLEAEDRMIAAQEQKVESLKAHKKGLMQQLFPQPGATTPALRFPGFTGKWQEKKLNKVFSRVTRKNAENNQNVLTISAQYGLISQLEFFKKSVASSDVTGYYLLHSGEFAYNKSSSQGRPVGAIKPLRLYDKGVVSTLYICFKCNNPEEIAFWEQYFDAGILDSEILSIAQEGARNHGLLNISTGDFFGLNVILPTPPEMKKIAECLSSFDDVITAAENELDSLKAHKKGLMQQLFPQL